MLRNRNSQFLQKSNKHRNSKLNDTTLNVSISFSLLISFIGDMGKQQKLQEKRIRWKKRKKE